MPESVIIIFSSLSEISPISTCSAGMKDIAQLLFVNENKGLVLCVFLWNDLDQDR